jgi:hypothetical protein
MFKKKLCKKRDAIHEFNYTYLYFKVILSF